MVLPHFLTYFCSTQRIPDEYARLCGFPDGILVKIGQVQKYTLQTAGKAAEVEVPPISE